MSKRYDYTDFLDADPDDKLSIFFMCIVNDIDPYIEGVHIIHNIQDEEDSIMYLFMYKILKDKCNEEAVLEGSQLYISHFTVQLQNGFSSILEMLVKQLYNKLLGVDDLLIDDITDIKLEDVVVSTMYHFSHHDPDEISRIIQLQRSLCQLKKFAQGKCVPDCVQHLRSDLIYKMVTSLWAQPLASLYPFSDLEREAINGLHVTLLQVADIRMFLEYNEMLKLKCPDRDIVSYMEEILIPKADNDLKYAMETLKRMTPNERKNYFLRTSPVSDLLLKQLLQGNVESIIDKAVECNGDELDRRLKECGGELFNRDTFSGNEPIHHYPLDKLIWHFEDTMVYLFLEEELNQLVKRINPFNRLPLPNYLFEQNNGPSKTIMEMWTELVRRKL